jgi:hypothetical protein
MGIATPDHQVRRPATVRQQVAGQDRERRPRPDAQEVRQPEIGQVVAEVHVLERPLGLGIPEAQRERPERRRFVEEPTDRAREESEPIASGRSHR